MKEKRKLLIGVCLISAFTLWTVLIQSVDVQPVGQNGTKIGFAAFNVWFHQLTGVHMTLYTITDWLGLVPVFICLCFGTLGFVQLVKRRSLLRVDPDIIILGVYYVIVIACYLVFEMIPINYRPVLIEGRLEASYPSSTTLLVLSVMPSLIFQVDRKSSESADQESELDIYNRFFGIYGNRQADFRSALGYGYYSFCIIICGAVYVVSVSCYVCG